MHFPLKSDDGKWEKLKGCKNARCSFACYEFECLCFEYIVDLPDQMPQIERARFFNFFSFATYYRCRKWHKLMAMHCFLPPLESKEEELG